MRTSAIGLPHTAAPIFHNYEALDQAMVGLQQLNSVDNVVTIVRWHGRTDSSFTQRFYCLAVLIVAYCQN